MAEELITKQAVLDLAYKGGSLAGLIHAFKVENLNGVNAVVLPCKVGDTVWCVRPELCVYRENDACDNYCDGFDTFCEEYEGGKWIEHSRFRLSMLDDIGKTVFLTREEAEKALEGREDNAR